MNFDDIAALIRRMARVRILRVAMIGAVGVTIQTILFDLLGVYLHVVEPSTAALIGGEVGVLTGFILNSRYSFNDRTGAPWPKRLMRFHLTVIGSVAIQWGLVFVTERATHNILILHLAFVAGVLIGFAWNYTWYHLWVWRHHAPSA